MRLRSRPSDARVWSAVLVQMKASGPAFPFLVQARTSTWRAWTEPACGVAHGRSVIGERRALLAHDSLQVVATAGRDPARRLVVGRVLEFETVQAQVVEGPSSVLP